MRASNSASAHKSATLRDCAERNVVANLRCVSENVMLSMHCRFVLTRRPRERHLTPQGHIFASAPPRKIPWPGQHVRISFRGPEATSLRIFALANVRLLVTVRCFQKAHGVTGKVCTPVPVFRHSRAQKESAAEAWVKTLTPPRHSCRLQGTGRTVAFARSSAVSRPSSQHNGFKQVRCARSRVRGHHENVRRSASTRSGPYEP